MSCTQMFLRLVATLASYCSDSGLYGGLGFSFIDAGHTFGFMLVLRAYNTLLGATIVATCTYLQWNLDDANLAGSPRVFV